MKAFFDEHEFLEDLYKLTASLERFNKPLVVLPNEKDVKIAEKDYGENTHITFISFDYWYSKKWLADDEYDHIDFFRIDKALGIRCYGVQAGCVTIVRTKKRKEEVSDEESN